MGNFFAVFAVLLIVGYGFLFVGGELGLILFAVAAVAFPVAMLISLPEKLDRLSAEVKSLKEQLGKAPEEADHGAE